MTSLTLPESDHGPSAEPEREQRRAPVTVLIIFFLAVIAIVPVVQLAIEAIRGERPGLLDVFRRKPTSANLRAYERDLDDASVAGNFLRPWIQYAQFAWLGDGGEKALVGRDGWLFYKPGLSSMLARHVPPAAGEAKDPLAAIMHFRDGLASRGIRLAVLIGPNKESVYPDMLTRRAAGLRGLLSPSTGDILERLRAAGVEVIDLFRAFEEARRDASGPPLYLVEDSHWSPAGVEVAARATARRLQDLGWVAPGGIEHEVRPAPVRRIGDVLRMLRVPLVERQAEPESVPCVQVVRRDDGRLYRDDPDSEVLVMGDSFLRIYERDEPMSAGFIAHLARELERPLASLVNDGGASTLVRQELNRRPSLLRGKKVVVWEFVERDIRLGAEGWQIVPLPHL